MQIIFIYDFEWGYNFKLKLYGRQWVIKCYVCPRYSLIMNTFFIMWNSSSTKICLETTDFRLSHNFYFYFLILIFPDWKNFSHFSRFSSASGNLLIMVHSHSPTPTKWVQNSRCLYTIRNGFSRRDWEVNDLYKLLMTCSHWQKNFMKSVSVSASTSVNEPPTGICVGVCAVWIPSQIFFKPIFTSRLSNLVSSSVNTPLLITNVRYLLVLSSNVFVCFFFDT